ncbi:MAG: periplasmic binding protein [Thermomicrobiales bacterium]|nr:periplasmic binding protein [Thermomicrobiales bacterium]
MRTRRISLFAFVVLLLATLPGAADASAQATPIAVTCVATPLATEPTAFPLTITDDAGRQVTIERSPTRIVSIAPSNTEMLFALGLDERIAGVDSYSTYPPEATQKPQVGTYLEPDLERVVAAEPDLILATEAHLGTVLPELDALGLPTMVIEPMNLDEVFSGMLLLGTITGVSPRAQQVVCELQERVDAVTDAIAGAPRSRVFFELSPDLYTAGPGSYVDDLISRAGGENVAAGAAELWPQLSAEAVVTADPEVILLADHEAGITAEQVAARPGWQEVSAVQQGRIVSLDADLVARPGPRVVDGLEAIAAALHPDLLPEAGS